MTKDDKLLITLRIDEVQFLIPEIYPKMLKRDVLVLSMNFLKL